MLLKIILEILRRGERGADERVRTPWGRVGIERRRSPPATPHTIDVLGHHEVVMACLKIF
jgi:hypothetical protein